jgi:hypothetical protein
MSAEDEYLTPLPPQPFSLEVAGAMAVAAIIHAGCCLLGNALSRQWPSLPSPNLRAVMMLLLGKFGDRDAELDTVVASITDYPLPILVYFLATLAIAIFLGKLSEKRFDGFLSTCGLSPSYQSTIGEWKEFFHPKENSGALVTAVVDMGGKAYLFAGVLVRIRFNPKTYELDRLLLEDVYKRPLAAATGESKPEFEEVSGNQFILRYAEIKTINVIYVDQSKH